MKYNPSISLRLFAIGIVLLLGGCQGFDEGPVISIYPVEDRIKNTWKWASAREDGVNLTGILADSTIEFGARDVLKVCAQTGGCREGSWTLISKNEEVQIIFGRQATAYVIQRLTRKELWLRHQGASLVEWQLKPVE